MKINVSRDLLMDKLNLTSRFTSNKLSSATALQGVLFKGSGDTIHMYATNLNAYIHTTIKTKVESEFQMVIEPKKIIEFLHFLTPGDVTFELKEKLITITKEKTKGNFPLMEQDEFPMPPELTEKEQSLDSSFLTKNIPMVLFTASQDESRPVLTGVNFTHIEDDLVIVSTDGFRLSIMKEKHHDNIPSMIIPADFLQEIIRNLKGQKEVLFTFSEKEKIVRFTLGEDSYYSRIIEGSFPEFQKVIPVEYKTKATVEVQEMLRNIKLISVFARDYSNVVICDFKPDGLYIKPKREDGDENTAFIDVKVDGDEQKVAFNFKFLIDFLSHVEGEEIDIEILRPDSPVIFRPKSNPSFFHIIMPVRIQQ